MKHILSLVFVLAFVLLTSAEVKCPEDSGDDIPIYLPHETECGKFYECSYRRAILFECPAGTYFDVRQNLCDWNVDCGDLATSTPPSLTTATDDSM